MDDSMKLQCIFGCKAKDKLRHYLSCQPLWLIVVTTMRQDIALLDLDVKARLGFVNPSKTLCLSLALAFRLYHMVKNEYRQRCTDHFDSGDDSLAYDIILECSRICWRDLQ